MPTSKDGREDSEATRKGVGGAEMTTLLDGTSGLGWGGIRLGQPLFFRSRNLGESFGRFPVGGENPVPGPPGSCCTAVSGSTCTGGFQMGRSRSRSPRRGESRRDWGSRARLEIRFHIGSQSKGRGQGGTFSSKEKRGGLLGTKAWALHASALRFEGSLLPNWGLAYSLSASCNNFCCTCGLGI